NSCDCDIEWSSCSAYGFDHDEDYGFNEDTDRIIINTKAILLPTK
uniref:Unknown protein 1 (Fragments) n=1 Tax=Lonomia obliqua TaxID=304329 RepID=UP01_LONON|nr:RecName: Full=Unknown protein 1 [Lonomia obliqua]